MILDTQKLVQKLKEKVNSIRIPRLIDLITNKTAKEIKENAPKENWDRMSLNKTWFFFVPIIVVLCVKVSRDAIFFFLDIGFKAIAILPLGLILYWLWKQFKK